MCIYIHICISLIGLWAGKGESKLWLILYSVINAVTVGRPKKTSTPSNLDASCLLKHLAECVKYLDLRVVWLFGKFFFPVNTLAQRSPQRQGDHITLQTSRAHIHNDNAGLRVQGSCSERQLAGICNICSSNVDSVHLREG